MRRPFIAGNWKMNKTIAESRELINELLPLVEEVSEVEIAVCPPATSLYPLSEILTGTPIKLGAQNMHWEESGAYTGDISPVMVREAGCEYVIIGHSERRKYYSETDEDVNKKVHAAFRCDLKPIICVGESLEQREGGETHQVVEKQVVEAIKGLSQEYPPSRLKDIVFAYEPIWAIGTGKSASPGIAQEVISKIRDILRSELGEIAEEIRIQYGGSVKPNNIQGFMAEKDIDGALVGGASLDAATFSQIVKYRR